MAVQGRYEKYKKSIQQSARGFVNYSWHSNTSGKHLQWDQELAMLSVL